LKLENVLLLFPLDPSKDPKNPKNVRLEFPGPGEKPQSAVEKVLSPSLSKNQKKKAKRRAQVRAVSHCITKAPCSTALSRAFTGEISAKQLVDAGMKWVI
jgi:hypothetical protein